MSDWRPPSKNHPFGVTRIPKYGVPIEAFPPPTPHKAPLSRPAQRASAAPTWTPPKTSSGVARRILVCLGSIIAFGVIRAVLTPSERSEIEEGWSALSAPERAMVCWGRDGTEQIGGTGVEGVTREVLNANCARGEAQAITMHAPLGQEAERKWLEEAKTTYEDAPLKAQEIGLTDAQVPTYCALSADELANSTPPGFLQMPWEGTAYEPSHEFTVQLHQLMHESLCG